MQLIRTERQRGGGVRSILGLGNHYNWFIKNYCVITAPLQELLKKSTHFRWDDEQEDVFVKLKEALCKDPVCNLAIDAVLLQVQDGEDKVMMYGSKAFSGSQQ